MEVSCGQPKHGFNLFWNVRFSGHSSFETWLPEFFSMPELLFLVIAISPKISKIFEMKVIFVTL